VIADAEPCAKVLDFVRTSGFARCGAVVTDLDGTVVHEDEGLSPTVEAGLKAIHDAGRQVLVDTMRFPGSVISAFGRAWHGVTGDAIPLVSLNGSQIGLVQPGAGGALEFAEIDAWPLEASDVREVMRGVRGTVANGGDELLVFFYPRDWRRGEQVWCASEQRVDAVAAKYRSASRVFHAPLDALEAELLASPMCLLFLQVDAPRDRLMAYQHTEISRFVTRTGVDKRHGAQALAARLGVSLADSIGAGDAPADCFLDACGLAVIVGEGALTFRGRRDTVRVDHPATFGLLMTAAAQALR
jgi:hypothetical protein